MRLCLFLLSAACLIACAHRPGNPNAIVVQGMVLDATGKDRARIFQDANDCASIAQATEPENKIAAGAIAGAVIGALLGAATYRAGGLSGNAGATYGAAVGSIGGGAGGANNAAHDYRTVLRNCMISRGHIPLN